MKFILTLFMVLVTGCASHYVPPTSGPTSLLVFPSKKSSYKLLGGFSTSSVTFAVESKNECGEFSRLLKPKPGEESVSVIIPSDKKIFVGVVYAFGNSSCVTSGSFISKEGVRYQVNPTITGRFCSVSVSKKSENDLIEKVDMQSSYVDSTFGLKVCSNKNDL